jgi:hypothetical protein
VNVPFVVVVEDDSGAVATDSLLIAQPFRDYPSIRHPEGYVDVVENRDTLFAWFDWNGGREITGFDVTFRYLNEVELTDLFFHDVPPNDTSVVVYYPFIPSNFEPHLYSWLVTVKDIAGNRATSLPGTFFYKLQQ